MTTVGEPVASAVRPAATAPARASLGAADGVPTRGEAMSWRGANATWLAASLRLMRLRLHRHALSLRGSGSAPIGDWLVAGDPSPRDTPVGRSGPTANAGLTELERRIQEEAKVLDELTRELEAADHQPALRALAELAGLSPLEEQILLLAAAPGLDGAFAPAYAEVHGDARREHATPHLALSLFVAPAAQQVYRLASSHGLARKDFTSVYTFLKPSSDQAPV